MRMLAKFPKKTYIGLGNNCSIHLSYGSASWESLPRLNFAEGIKKNTQTLSVLPVSFLGKN